MIFARSSPAMRNRSTLPRGRLARQVKPRGASELLLPMPPKFVDRDPVDIRGAIGFAFVWRNDILLVLQSSNRKQGFRSHATTRLSGSHGRGDNARDGAILGRRGRSVERPGLVRASLLRPHLRLARRSDALAPREAALRHGLIRRH